MKTTIELDDELLIAAKRRAAQDRTTLKMLIDRGLRAELARRRRRSPEPGRRHVRLVVVDGGVPEGLDVANREAVHDWLQRTR